MSIKFYKTVKALLLMSLVSILAACMPNPGDVSIDAPLEGAVWVNQQPVVELSYASGTDLGSVTVTLNGRNIKDMLTMGAESATLDTATVKALLVQGANVISVGQPEKDAAVRRFTYDDTGPAVNFASAKANGSNVDVEGTATDVGGVASLTINGQSIPVAANGSFSGSVPQAAEYAVLATDDYNLKSYTHYAAAGATLDPMIKASIDEAVIEGVGPVVAGILAAQKDRAVFDVINPVVSGQIPIAGFNFAVNLTALEALPEAEGGTATVNALAIDPAQTGTITADIDITEAKISAELLLYAGGADAEPLKFDVNIFADNINILAGIGLGIADGGTLSVSVDNTALDLTGTSVDVVGIETLPIFGPLIAGFLESELLNGIVDSVEGAIGPALAGELTNRISGLIERIFGGPLFLGLDINDENLQLVTNVSSLGANGNDLVAELSGVFKAKNISEFGDNYALGVPVSSSIDQLTGDITLEGALPDPSDDGQINAVVNFDLVNQALLMAYQLGALNINAVLNQGSLTLVSAADVAGVAAPGAILVNVQPSVPELLLSGDDTRADLGINLNNFSLVVSLGSATGWNELFLVDVGVGISAGFGFNNATNSIFLQAGQATPEIVINQVSAFGALDVPPALANTVVGLVVPIVADAIVSVVNIQLPIPAELPVQVKNISTVGTGPSHLNVSLDVDLAGILAGLPSE